MTCFPSMSWEYIDENMDFRRLAAMNSYWRKHPPMHELLAAWVGYKPPEQDVNETVLAPGSIDAAFDRFEAQFKTLH